MAARRDGRPRWIDLSQREVVTSLLGDQVLATSLGAPDPVPTGNSSPGRTEWLSRAAGEDQWIAVGVGSREDEDRLAAVVGTDLAALGDAAARAAALRAATDRWAGDRSPAGGAAELRSGGVAAVAVRSGEELLDDPYLREQGWWQPVDRPDGTVEQQRGWAVRFAEGGPAAVRRRAPHLGEHTDAVLAELGYSADEIRELTERGVVTTPQAHHQREART